MQKKLLETLPFFYFTGRLILENAHRRRATLEMQRHTSDKWKQGEKYSPYFSLLTGERCYRCRISRQARAYLSSEGASYATELLSHNKGGRMCIMHRACLNPARKRITLVRTFRGNESVVGLLVARVTFFPAPVLVLRACPCCSSANTDVMKCAVEKSWRNATSVTSHSAR